MKLFPKAGLRPNLHAEHYFHTSSGDEGEKYWIKSDCYTESRLVNAIYFFFFYSYSCHISRFYYNKRERFHNYSICPDFLTFQFDPNQNYRCNPSPGPFRDTEQMKFGQTKIDPDQTEPWIGCYGSKFQLTSLVSP